MAAAFHLAGFETWDVCMQDLLDLNVTLDRFDGIAFVGGFSYADVFGAAKGKPRFFCENKLRKRYRLRMGQQCTVQRIAQEAI